MVPADKEMTEVVLPLQKEMTKEDKVPSPKKKRDEDSEPSPKKRRLNDSRYYEALDTVLQQALEDKKEAANALVRVEDEKLLMAKEMEELKQRLASAENQKVEGTRYSYVLCIHRMTDFPGVAETQLATKVDECKTLEDQLTTLQQRGISPFSSPTRKAQFCFWLQIQSGKKRRRTFCSSTPARLNVFSKTPDVHESLHRATRTILN